MAGSWEYWRGGNSTGHVDTQRLPSDHFYILFSYLSSYTYIVPTDTSTIHITDIKEELFHVLGKIIQNSLENIWRVHFYLFVD